MTVTEIETWQDLADELRARDSDPAYAAAPVLDVYGRISRHPETGETEKVDRQLLDTLVEVGRRRARLGEVLRDDGKSAWSLTAKRPDWQRLVARLESKQSAGVIAWHTDRLMRQPRDLELLISFGERGLIVGSCHGDYDLSNADDRFTLRVLTAAAAKDSDSTSRRQKRKAEAMRAQGKKSGGPRWFGMPGRTAGVPAPAELVAAEREAIAWAARAHLDGISLNEIAREWNRRGVHTVRGNAWDARTVAPILRHPRIAGLLAYQGHVIGRLDGVEPIVTAEEYDALQATFAARRLGRPPGEAYPLSGGVLFCGGCGRGMCGKASFMRGRSQRRYVCRPVSGGCGRVGMTAERLEAEVIAMVVATLSDPKHARMVARQSAKLGEAQQKLSAARQTAEELSRRLGEGRMDLGRYDAAMGPLDARINKLQADVDALRDVGADRAARVASADEVAADWESADAAEKRVMVRRAAPRGIVVLPATSTHSTAAERLKVL